MSKGKTPYEIRTDLLILAREILSSRAQDNDKNPKAPTTEEIIEEATKLNQFVSSPQIPERK